MKEMIDLVTANLAELSRQLAELRGHVVAMGDVVSARKTTEANLKSVQSALVSAQADLAHVKSGLSAAQTKNIQKHDEAIFAKTKELEDLAGRTAIARGELDTVTVELRSASERKQAIADELAIARKRFG